MIKNSTGALFLLHLSTMVSLTRILRVFPIGKFDPSPRVTDELSAGKTFSRLQKRPHLSSAAHSSGNQNILGCFSEVLPSATVALFSIPFLAASWEKL